MAKVLAVSDAHSGLRKKLRDALQAKHPAGRNSYDDAYPDEVFDDKVVHNIPGKTGKLFATKYTKKDDGTITLGDPQEVEPAYKPLSESSQGFVGGGVIEVAEAAYDKSSGRLKVTVIKPGFNTSGMRYYPSSTLVRDHKIFEGAKMFANHQTEAEAKSRPEGDVRDWVGSLLETSVEGDGTIVGVAQVHDPAFKAKLEGLQEAGLLHEMGISIRAAGRQRSAEVEKRKTMVVESFIAAKSVDFVTYPGAGGKVDMLESDATDVDFITVEMLTERRPDIVDHFTRAAQEAANMAKTVQELENELAESKRLQKAAEDALQESTSATAKSSTQTSIGVLLEASKLPAPAKERIKVQYKDATKIDGVAESIAAEEKYIADLGKTGVKNMGESQQTVEPGASVSKEVKEAQVKAWMKTGMTEAQANAAVANIIG